MSTKHLVDPQLLGGLDLMPAFELSDEALPAFREGMNQAIAATPLPIGDGIERSEAFIPGLKEGDPDIRLLIYKPEQAKGELPAILYMHGGGYVMGTADMGDPRCRDFVRELGVIVIGVDYRLAPETHFPGPHDDCYASLLWLKDKATDLGVDASRIAVYGESAGGGLAASTALRARDEGTVDLAYQALIYPMIDDRVGQEPSGNPYTGEFVWTRAANRYGWSSMLGKLWASDGDVPAYAAPARVTELANLPPAFICVGALDLFLEEDIDYAKALLQAGVPVHLAVYPGAYHGFEISPEADISIRMRRDLMSGLRTALLR